MFFVVVLFDCQNMLGIYLASSDEVSRNAYYAHIYVHINHQIQAAHRSRVKAKIEKRHSVTEKNMY
jgi:hypothetical protein